MPVQAAIATARSIFIPDKNMWLPIADHVNKYVGYLLQAIMESKANKLGRVWTDMSVNIVGLRSIDLLQGLQGPTSTDYGMQLGRDYLSLFW